MFCYNCDSVLTDDYVCPQCGADVRMYTKLIHTSNRYYNEGLEKAGVRDLSGAVESLSKSIRLYKYNIDARNLLGLVYFEMGEVVPALSQWVISRSIEKDKNPATAYILNVQNDKNRLGALEQAVHKYNIALNYCNQGSLDLATIQLRKVVQLNPQFLKARQLLSLLYIETGDLRRADRELRRCTEIDRNNTTTLRYQAEVQRRRLPEDEETGGGKETPSAIRYVDGNETIIRPVGGKTPGIDGGVSIVNTIINIAIGLLIGAAVVGFFVLPARVAKVRTESAEEVRAIGEESDAKTATISEQQATIDDLTSQNTALEADVAKYKAASETSSADKALLEAAALYLENPEDLKAIGDALGNVDETAGETETSAEYEKLYGDLMGEIRPGLQELYYNDGYNAYQNGDYETAIAELLNAVKYGDITVDRYYAASEFYLADAYYEQYREASDTDKEQYRDNIAAAQKYFSDVKNNFPDTNFASDAASKLEELSSISEALGNTTG